MDERSQDSCREMFGDAVVILNDGNQIMMKKCLKCGFVVRNHVFSRVSHWRNCPQRFYFKYFNENNIGGSIHAICLICNSMLEPKLTQMIRHHEQCKKNTTLTQNDLDAIIAANTDDAPSEIPFILESSVTQREIDGQLRIGRVATAPGYLTKYTSTSKGFERVVVCQVCGKSVKKPSLNYFSFHRKRCALPNEILLSVKTQPFDMTISSSMEDSPIPAATENRTCFICNTTASESYVNLYETVTSHSNTPVYDFVWKFLGDKPSIRDDSIDGANANWSSLCLQCFNKINEYDLACETAGRLEEELRWELSQTEARYGQQYVGYEVEDLTESSTMAEVETETNTNEQDYTLNHDGPLPVESVIIEDPNAVPIDTTQCTIELSDSENEQTIELSDDDD